MKNKYGEEEVKNLLENIDALEAGAVAE